MTEPKTDPVTRLLSGLLEASDNGMNMQPETKVFVQGSLAAAQAITASAAK